MEGMHVCHREIRSVSEIRQKDIIMAIFIFPLLLLVILICALWFHDVQYRRQEVRTGQETKPIL